MLLLLSCFTPSPLVRVVCFNADLERVYAGACPKDQTVVWTDEYGVHFRCSGDGPTIAAAKCFVGEATPLPEGG